MVRGLPILALAAIFHQGVVAQCPTDPPPTDPIEKAERASKWENSQHANADPTFYDVPSNFSRDLAPGTILKIEHATNLTKYLVPTSQTLSRILYTSLNLNGSVVPASAYVLWPYMPASFFPQTSSTPSFPLVAWAHGTSGLFPACAPSNYKALQFHFMVPFHLASQGIAVVAPDYAGLGASKFPDRTPFPHEYTAAPATANDIAYAIVAARSAFPENLPADGPVVTAGHSQGGGAAWAFAQLQASGNGSALIKGYKGTLALAPGPRFIDPIMQAWTDLAAKNIRPWTYTLLGIQRNIIAGITAVYPSFNLTGMVPAVRERWLGPMTRLSGCLPTDVQLFEDIYPHLSATPGWWNRTEAQEFKERTKVGGKPFKGPLLVIAGGSDSAAHPEVIKAPVDETCDLISSGNSTESMEYVEYPGVDHFPVVTASQEYWVQWVKDRLSGCTSKTKRAAPGCKRRTVAAFRQGQMLKNVAPNWLVTEADLGMFQYTL